MADESIGLKTSFGEIAAKGTTVVLLVALCVLGYLALREHGKREAGEKQIIETVRQENKLNRDTTLLLDCRVQLAIYLSRGSRDQPIDWSNLPGNLYGCLPEFLTRQGVQR
jgi:hypothetical protein